MNICPKCDAHFGDHFLFREPEGAFCPETEEDAGRAIIRNLMLHGTFEFDGAWHMGAGDILWSHGKKM